MCVCIYMYVCIYIYIYIYIIEREIGGSVWHVGVLGGGIVTDGGRSRLISALYGGIWWQTVCDGW